MADDEQALFEQEEEIKIDEAAAASNAKTRDAAVKRLLQTDAVGALKASLENPPLGSQNDDTKQLSARTVAAVLGAIKDQDIASTLNQLSTEQHNLLMKYIYRGLSINENSTQLLKVHEKLVEKAGQGCIVRALSDKLTV